MGHTTCKVIDSGCAYVCTLHKDWVKWTHCQTITWVNNEKLSEYHKMHILWLRLLNLYELSAQILLK